MALRALGDGQGVSDQESAFEDFLGRNRVFYVNNKDLVTKWYLAKRCAEEFYRSERYDRPLSLLLIEPLATTEEGVVRRQVGAWVRKELRVTDIPTFLGGRRYAVLLVETNPEEASIIAGRLRASVRNISIGLSHFPEDGSTLDGLIAVVPARMRPSTILLLLPGARSGG